MRELAKAICETASVDQAWERLLADADRLFWSNDEALPASWTRLFGSAVGGADVEEIWRGDQLRYRYQGRSKAVPLRGDPDDPLVTMHALARLVRHDVEFRMCRASGGNSEQAFLAMPPADWIALETALGRVVVGRHFVRLAASFDAFMERAFGASDKAAGSFKPQVTVWEGVVSYIKTNLDYVIVCDGPGQVRHDALHQLLCQHLIGGPVSLCVGNSDEQRSLDRDLVTRAVLEWVGRKEIRIVDGSGAGFVVIEPNGVAAGWRTDTGLQTQTDSPRPSPDRAA